MFTALKGAAHFEAQEFNYYRMSVSSLRVKSDKYVRDGMKVRG